MDLLFEMGSLRERQDSQSEALRNEIARWQALTESRQADVEKRLRDTEHLVRQMEDEQQARTVALETWLSKLAKSRGVKRGSVAELEEDNHRWASWALVSAELQQRLDKVEKRSSEVKFGVSAEKFPVLSARIDTLEEQLKKLSSGYSTADPERVHSSASVGEPGPAKHDSRRRCQDVGRDIEDLRSHLTCTLEEIRNEMVDVRKGFTQEQKKRRDLTWEVERLAEEVGTVVSQSMLVPFDSPVGDVRWKQVSEPTCATPSQSLGLEESRGADAQSRHFEMSVTPGIYSFSANAEVPLVSRNPAVDEFASALGTAAGASGSVSSSLTADQVQECEDTSAPDGSNGSLRNLQNAIGRFSDVLGASLPIQKRAKHPTMSWERSSRTPRRSAAQASHAPLPKAVTSLRVTSPVRQGSPSRAVIKRGSSPGPETPPPGTPGPSHAGASEARWSSRQCQSPGRPWACNVGAVHHEGRSHDARLVLIKGG